MTGTWFQMQAQAETQAHDNYDEGKLVAGHLGEGLLKLLGDGLELLLLGDELVLEPVHLLLQLGHRPLGELSAGLSLPRKFLKNCSEVNCPRQNLPN